MNGGVCHGVLLIYLIQLVITYGDTPSHTM